MKSYQDDICGASVTTEVYAKCHTGHWSTSYSYGSYSESVGAQEWGWTTFDSNAVIEARELEIAIATKAHPDYAIGVGA